MIIAGRSVVDWVTERINPHGGWGKDAQGIGVARDGKLIAGVIYTDYNTANVNMHVAAVDKSEWLTRLNLRYFFDYPFNQMQVKRITALVSESNAKSVRLIEGVGFRHETTLTDAAPDGDLLVYVMRRNDCIWIKENHEKIAA